MHKCCCFTLLHQKIKQLSFPQALHSAKQEKTRWLGWVQKWLVSADVIVKLTWSGKACVLTLNQISQITQFNCGSLSRSPKDNQLSRFSCLHGTKERGHVKRKPVRPVALKGYSNRNEDFYSNLKKSEWHMHKANRHSVVRQSEDQRMQLRIQWHRPLQAFNPELCLRWLCWIISWWLMHDNWIVWVLIQKSQDYHKLSQSSSLTSLTLHQKQIGLVWKCSRVFMFMFGNHENTALEKLGAYIRIYVPVSGN